MITLFVYKLICTGKKEMNKLQKFIKNTLSFLQHTHLFWKMNNSTMNYLIILIYG